MRVIKLLVAVLVIVVLAGCRSEENKKYKMREFLHKYGNVTIGDVYEQSGFIVPHHNFEDLAFTISSLKIKSDNIKERDGETYHFVKAKMVYVFTPKSKSDKKELQFVRWMALTIHEDGFGNMQVAPSQSIEYVAVGDSEKMMNMIFGKQMKLGEELMK